MMNLASKEPINDSLDNIIKYMNEAYSLDENLAVEESLASINISPEINKRIENTASGLVKNIRKNRSKFGGLDSFLQEFGLSTKAGIALMCLAEALLRIPDSATADRLIRDKIGGADWDKHIGKGSDLFVNASTWALMLTGKVIKDVDEEKASAANIAGKMVSTLGEPLVRKAILHSMKIMGKQFVMGKNIEDALTRSKSDEKSSYRHSFDMLGEGARTDEDAENYFKNYEMAIDAIGKFSSGRDVISSPGISVKLSAIHPRFNYSQRDTCVPEISEKLLHLAQKCSHYNIGMTVDAEEAHRLEITLKVIENVFSDSSLKTWEGFGFALQTYQKRSLRCLDWLIALSEENNNRRMMIRLVKGAYWDSEIKYAQVNGLNGYPVFTRKAATDVSYLACASKLMERRDIFYPMFASHNAHTISTLIELAGDNKKGFEFQRLHGMGESLFNQITGNEDGKYPCRIYSPVGNHQDLLPYLVRRLLENGANSSFVNRLQNDKVPISEIIASPIEYIKNIKDKPHPKIPLPANIYGDARKNSQGIEFADSNISEGFLNDIKSFSAKIYNAMPIINGIKISGDSKKSLSPINHNDELGSVIFATKENIESAIKVSYKGFNDWNNTPATLRADILEKTAVLMEENKAELMSLCIREGGKTLPDAIAEIREAIDFCRYYAAEGKKHFAEPKIMQGPTGESNNLKLEGRGIFLCISPWNFPLAIFLGQVSAALMAGNTVIAKPAGQTNIIASYIVELLYKAGLPQDALSFLPVSGKLVGEIMIPDARIAGVCFTGSTEVAQQINRSLANRKGAIVPLIAETGGQNAMIADSSALPEQIVDDVIISAFHSAGQRCSALRVLFIQDGITDKVIKMLDGACKKIILGDPSKLSTDIGPVIDNAAASELEEHAQRMDKEAKAITKVSFTSECENGSFFAPRAYEIESMAQLPQEIFGPVLHIIRYKAEELDKVIEQINATEYGLTFGIHSRIEHQVNKICSKIKAGNCYINRSMIGAVVGVQPFGGQGLSGTGPKAGGPHYLLRFATEKTITINTTAAGGNTTLVSLTED